MSNPRSRCAAGAQNPLDRIVDALPISEIQQEQLTEEEEENGKRRQSDNSNAALDDSTMELKFFKIFMIFMILSWILRFS